MVSCNSKPLKSSVWPFEAIFPPWKFQIVQYKFFLQCSYSSRNRRHQNDFEAPWKSNLTIFAVWNVSSVALLVSLLELKLLASIEINQNHIRGKKKQKNIVLPFDSFGTYQPKFHFSSLCHSNFIWDSTSQSHAFASHLCEKDCLQKFPQDRLHRSLAIKHFTFWGPDRCFLLRAPQIVCW